MSDNVRIIRETRHLIKNSSAELCNLYNELCISSCAEAILSVLDGELRMAVKLAKLEDFFSKDAEKVYASEYETEELLNKNQDCKT
ncbi:MAG: hypothetical protein ACI4I7_04725 [Oscillospiraceae bacterium]